MASSFFDRDGEWFIPNEETRGPWDADACHGGPPTGLLARASEQAIPDQQLVRITVNLTRPVPMTRFRIEADVTRRGRTVSTTALQMFDGDHKPIIAATALHIDGGLGDPEVPTTPANLPAIEQAVDGSFPVEGTAHGRTWFGDGTENKILPTTDHSPSPPTLWMRTIPLLADEPMSPFQRICPLGDCGNAISRNADIADGYSFVNPDLTIVMHRAPAGDWIGSQSVSRWEATGIGMSDSLLFDQTGALGRAIQTLLIRQL